jgi:hypothetical protein
MHGILPPQRRRQCITIKWQFDTALACSFGILANPPCLVTFAAAVGACIRSVKQKPDLTTARRSINFRRTQDKMPCPCFQAQPVKKCLFQATFDTSGNIVNQRNFVSLERSAQQSGKFSFGLRFGEFVAVYTYPRPATGGFGKQVRRDGSVGAERKPDERGAVAMLTR